jgi:uncharacterized phage protein (TIGR01671 family)
MREIKFRAWDISRKVMHVVYRLTFSDEGDEPFSHEEAQIHYEHEWHTLDRDGYILMQYTGRKDKNGVEIYEGDIAKQRRAGWSEGNLTGGEVKIEVSRGVTIGNWPAAFDIEVIGNIHQNPKLLE